MQYKSKMCIIEPFSVERAQVKTGFDVRYITDIFHETLSKLLGKKGMSIRASSAGGDTQEITVKGQFVRIDEGNRWLRYFLTFIAGKAILEVEGKVFVGDKLVTTLHAKASQGMGLFFGGGGKGLLKVCTKAVVKKITKQIIKGLKKY